MSAEMFDKLESRIVELLAAHQALQEENNRLRQDFDRLSEERGDLKARIDSILKKLEGV